MNYEIINFKSLGDARGELVAIEGGQSIPFDIKRTYCIFRTEEGVERGFHAHKELRQVAIAVSGFCDMVLDDGSESIEVRLDSPLKGLLIGPGFWRVMKNFSEDCVLLVLADQHYEESDYLRDYNDFKKWILEKDEHE